MGQALHVNTTSERKLQSPKGHMKQDYSEIILARLGIDLQDHWRLSCCLTLLHLSFNRKGMGPSEYNQLLVILAYLYLGQERSIDGLFPIQSEAQRCID